MRNFILVSVLLFCTNLFSQQSTLKNDIIMTTDGQLLQVKVTKVAENVISFNYPGESVVNEIKSDGIDKIVFASGRTQNFNGKATKALGNDPQINNTSTLPEETVEALNYEENTIAIVPLSFERNGGYDKALAMAATDYITGLVSNKATTKGIKVLDKGKAVEKLLKAGVNYDKLRQSSPSELRDVFGTEYILYVSIEENEKNGKTDDSYSDFMDRTSVNNTQMGRIINMRLYCADSEVESFEVDFSEHVFKKKKEGGSNSLTDGKWKSSLRYLTDQLFTYNVFSNKKV